MEKIVVPFPARGFSILESVQMAQGPTQPFQWEQIALSLWGNW